MKLRWLRNLVAIRGRRSGASPRPCGRREAWPDAQNRWIDDNGANRPRAARQVLFALAARDTCGGFRARPEGGGWIVTGPAGSIALADPAAEIHFVALVSAHAYADGP